MSSHIFLSTSERRSLTANEQQCVCWTATEHRRSGRLDHLHAALTADQVVKTGVIFTTRASFTAQAKRFELDPNMCRRNAGKLIRVRICSSVTSKHRSDNRIPRQAASAQPAHTNPTQVTVPCLWHLCDLFAPPMRICGRFLLALVSSICATIGSIGEGRIVLCVPEMRSEMHLSSQAAAENGLSDAPASSLLSMDKR